MNLIKQFMKIGGFKTPDELEAYGEDNFFRDFPEAKKLALGGTPEAFNMTMPADKFFSYGVPVPPTYYQKGGNTAAASSTYVNMPVPKLSQRMKMTTPGDYTTLAVPDPSGLPGDSIRFFLGHPTVTGGTPYIRDLGNAVGVSDESPESILQMRMDPNAPTTRVYEDTLRVKANQNPNSLAYPLLGKESGGSLTNRMVYPQIQSADQFFSPVYSNSNNAYAMGGNTEAFPQAVSYPQAGWGKTNYFMLSEGGAFPPGMPQYTGMLPVMQTGASLDAIVSRTNEDNYHYGIKPMQSGGEPGMTADNPALARLQKFIGQIQTIGQNNLTKAITPQDEEITEPGAKYGGNPLPKAQNGTWQKVVLDGVEGFINPDTNQFYAPYSGKSTDSKSTTYNNQVWGYDPMWVMPGRYRPSRISRGMDVYLDALAAGQIARGDVKLEKVRNRMIPGTGVRSMTFSVPGDIIQEPNYYLNEPKKNRKGLRDFLRGKQEEPDANLPQSFSRREPKPDELIQPGDYNPNVRKAYDFNFRPGQGSFPPSGGWQDFPGTMEKTPVGPVEIQKHGGPFALPMFQRAGEVMTQGNPDTFNAIKFETDDIEDVLTNPVGYEETDTPYSFEQASRLVDGVNRGPRKKFKIKKGKDKGSELGPDAIMAMMAAGTNLLEKAGWNQDTQDFNSALDVYGMSRKPTNRGSYLTNDPGVGNTFRPDQYNWNMRGFYTPDFGYAQTGGQQFANMDGDQYYLTQEQINKVIKAGGKVPGF